MSYVGLFSYYQFDNWAYQPTYVSSNTPWFFNGVRIQIFPTEHLKIEPWLTNGWQSYGRFNGRPGVDNPERFLDKAAFSLTGDMGCERSEERRVGKECRSRWSRCD